MRRCHLESEARTGAAGWLGRGRRICWQGGRWSKSFDEAALKPELARGYLALPSSLKGSPMLLLKRWAIHPAREESTLRFVERGKFSWSSVGCRKYVVVDSLGRASFPLVNAVLR